MVLREVIKRATEFMTIHFALGRARTKSIVKHLRGDAVVAHRICGREFRIKPPQCLIEVARVVRARIWKEVEPAQHAEQLQESTTTAPELTTHLPRFAPLLVFGFIAAILEVAVNPR